MIAVASTCDARRPQRAFAVVGLLVALSLPAASHALQFQRSDTIEDVGTLFDFAAQALVLADVDHDEHLDLIAFDNNSSVIKIYVGDGNGGFSEVLEIEIGEFPVAVASADLLGRSRTDIVAVSDDGTVTVLLQGEDPLTFTQSGIGDILSEIDLAAVAIADFSSPPDGLPDLAVLGEDSFEEQVVIQVLRNQGDGTFASFAEPLLRISGALPNSLAAGLFNDDTRVDLAVTMMAVSGGGRLAQFTSSSDGAFTFRGALNLGTEADPRTLVVADFNADSKLDLGTIDAQSDTANAFRFLRGLGSGNFSAEQTPDESAVEFFPNSLATADFDLDGHPDVVTTHGFEAGVQTLSMLLNRGPEHGFERVAVRGLALGGDQAALTTGYVDGDARPDIVVLMEDGSVQVLLNVADDTPTPTATAVLPPSATPTSTSAPTLTATQIPTATPRPPTATPPNSPTRTVTPQPANTIVAVTPSGGSSGCDLSGRTSSSAFWPVSLLLVGALWRRRTR